jgi:uncharacterized membrane protein YkvA (DUF1232 family)
LHAGAEVESSGGWLATWKARAAALEHDTYALYLAYRDPRVSWAAKAIIALVVAYALSPIDLIPDFIPVLGYVDDLLLVPLGITFAVKLVAPDVLAEHRAEARRRFAESQPRSWLGAAMVLSIWLVLAVWIAIVGLRAVAY